VEEFSFSRGLCSSLLSRQKLAWPVSQTDLTGFALWAVEKGFWARKSLLHYGFFCSSVERLLMCFLNFGEFRTKSVWLVCQTGLTSFPCLREAKSNRSGLTGFRNRPDQFGLPAALLCVFPLRVCCGCWLGLAPRFSSTSVATWTWQEELAEVHEWNLVHRPNSWIEFLSTPIHSPLSGSSFRSFTFFRELAEALPRETEVLFEEVQGFFT
jgi:hypothetical protein